MYVSIESSRRAEYDFLTIFKAKVHNNEDITVVFTSRFKCHHMSSCLYLSSSTIICNMRYHAELPHLFVGSEMRSFGLVIQLSWYRALMKTAKFLSGLRSSRQHSFKMENLSYWVGLLRKTPGIRFKSHDYAPIHATMEG